MLNRMKMAKYMYIDSIHILVIDLSRQFLK